MHVLVEGVCVKELACLLNHVTLNYKIKLEDFNTSISSFVYPIIDASDKPNTIKKDHLNNASLAQSAGQMLTLMLNLSFILGDIFEDNDKNWLNFINLHEIMNLVFCFYYDKLTVNHLEEKINDYLREFKKLHENIPFTPKIALFVTFS